MKIKRSPFLAMSGLVHNEQLLHTYSEFLDLLPGGSLLDQPDLCNFDLSESRQEHEVSAEND